MEREKGGKKTSKGEKKEVLGQKEVYMGFGKGKKKSYQATTAI